MARRTVFSFHYKPNVMRAWNVRNSWVAKVAQGERSSAGFFDSSVVEAAERENVEALKSFTQRTQEYERDVCACRSTYGAPPLGALRDFP
jgi:hypothetical protein